ncbi:glycoside hydrolase 15 protein [Arachnomyces sp. PD_36]|nr:glycoside hydrolase 15 protein [Arachnomyces sp. PD_36]
MDIIKAILVATLSLWFGYVKKNSGSLDDFISTQTPIARQGILNNIGPDGINAWGASDGVVIASPSKSDPDYFFTWTRDAALTLRYIIDLWNGSGDDRSFQSVIDDYVSSQAIIQTIQNPSGSLSNGDGLGEAKYQVNFNAFTEPWGRPQHDGPALRAIALITYAQRSSIYTVRNILWPIIQNDLAYIALHWNETGFDLWEEVKGSSFFTAAAQYHALVEGNWLAEAFGLTCDHCISQVPQMFCFLQSFWSEADHYIVSNINTEWDTGRTGKDANSILASLQLFDPGSPCYDSTFQPCSARALANHKAVVDSFRSLYPINANIPSDSGVAVGRYAEDVYMGGHPWYITTHAAAEQLYAAIHQFSRQGLISISDVSLPFFQSLPLPPTTPELKSPSYIQSDDPLFATLKTAILEYADSFLSISQSYTPDTGFLAEQFNRENGQPLSAENLTWSYTSFLTSVNRRSDGIPRSWSLPLPPDRCPRVTPPDPVPTFKSPCATTGQAQSIVLSFAVRHPEPLPESTKIYITGSHRSLALWDTSKAIPLSLTTPSQGPPVWNATIREGFTPNVEIEYKYIQKNEAGDVVWESDPNRKYTVPSACDGMVVGVYDTWR